MMLALTQELAGRGVPVASDTGWRFAGPAGQRVKKGP
jgi:hypothetical protein